MSEIYVCGGGNICWLDKMKKIENLSNQNDGFDETSIF